MPVRYTTFEQGAKLTQPGAVVSVMVSPELCGAEHLSIGLLELEPGATTIPNVHRRSEEAFYILEGEGLFRADQQVIRISAGGALYIDKNITHSFTNTGKGTLRFLLIAAPPLVAEDTAPYAPLEE